MEYGSYIAWGDTQREVCIFSRYRHRYILVSSTLPTELIIISGRYSSCHLEGHSIAITSHLSYHRIGNLIANNGRIRPRNQDSMNDIYSYSILLRAEWQSISRLLPLLVYQDQIKGISYERYGGHVGDGGGAWCPCRRRCASPSDNINSLRG